MEAKDIAPQAAQTLDEVLVDAINSTGGAIGEAVDFTLTQAPEVVEQLLMWHMMQSAVTNIICLVLAILFVVVPTKHLKKVLENSGEYWEWGPVALCPYIPFCLTIMCFDLVWLKIWVAPKLYLLEYAASLVK